MNHPVSIDENILGGTPVFNGTRVPIRTFIDYLENGENIHTFMNDFSTVTSEHISSFLEQSSTIYCKQAA